MKMRRVFSLLLSICLLFSSALPFQAIAEDIVPLEQVLTDACIYRRNADISSYKISSKELETVFHHLYCRGALPWYTADNFGYTYIQQTGHANTFEPKSLYDGAENMAVYEEQVAQILNQCVFEGMSQWQIALSLHDYLIANIVYDETLEKNTAYDALIHGTAVCSGYSQAYQDLMLRAGVDCIFVVSPQMEHSWNLVCIDDNWYHVDLTWDDPTPDNAGYVSHDYFLRTDSEISAGEESHYGWETDIRCTDTRFSNGFWQDVYSPILYKSSTICYLLRSSDFVNSIYSRDETTGRETLLYKEQIKSIDIGYGPYRYDHQGLSFRDNRLYFASLSRVISMRPDGTDRQTEYNHQGNTYIGGCYVSGDTGYLTLMSHEGMPAGQQFPLASSPLHAHSFTRRAVAATCTEDGYTESVCSCGMRCESNPTEATGHRYTATAGQKATPFSNGFTTYTCENCADCYTETLPQLAVVDFLKDHLTILVPAVLGISALLFRVCRGKKRRNS